MVSVAFLKQLLAGQKSMIRLQDASIIEVPEKYHELEIPSLLTHCANEDIPIDRYMPGNDPAKICRGYLINVVLFDNLGHEQPSKGMYPGYQDTGDT